MRPFVFSMLFAICIGPSWAQNLAPDTLILDSLAIMEESVKGYWDSISIPPSEFAIDPWRAQLILNKGYDWSQIQWKYKTYPFRTWVGQFPPQQTKRFQRIPSPNKIRQPSDGGFGGVQTSGFVSRGIQLGNNQNLNIQSGMNLQLSGRLNADWQIKATLSDANIPIQPGGTSAKLEDFDQIFVVLNNKRSEITGGDFFVSSIKSDFVKYNKRAQGIKWKFQDNGTQFEVSTSLTKGRFARQVIQGIEGSQGPYRLVGAQGENYIIVLAGTETVYIDGKKLKRGQDQDYVIDYNAGLLTFMPTQLITKDKRITIEFQYSDKQYIRPLITTQWSRRQQNWEFFGGYFNESDAKNQPLQLNLSDSAKWILSQAGDQWNAQFLESSRLAENKSQGVLYESLDTLGFSNVWIYSTDTSAALYQVAFSYVGWGKGDYKENGYAAGGKVYQWVAPLWDGSQWVKQGDFIDKVKLTAPNRLQVFHSGCKRNIQTHQGTFVCSTEGAISSWDQNTFSSRQDEDNIGWIAKSRMQWRDTSGKFQWGAGYEFQSKRFQRVERFREVEFERNWNLLGKSIAGDWQFLSSDVQIKLKHHQVQYQWERLQIGPNWSANRWRWKGTMIQKNQFHWKIDGWWMDSKGIEPSLFLRNKDDIQWKGKLFRVFYQDEWERNQRTWTETAKPYAFLDYTAGWGSADTNKVKWVVFYRNRWDELPSMVDSHLAVSTLAEQWGLDWAIQWNPQTKISGVLSRRQLMVKDHDRFQGNPERTLLGKWALNWRDKKGTWNLSMYYQLGSGLEQRKSFLYLEVPLGQGSFVWVDYNQDGVKDLNEFEIPAFGYEANYIRTQVPNADFVSVSTHQATGVMQWHPNQGWARRWSNAINVQSEVKRQGQIQYNFFDEDAQDSAVVQSLFLLRDQLQWNASDPTWGASLAYQWNQSKSGLTLGYEWREDRYISPQIRIGGGDLFSMMPSYKKGWKSVASDFLVTRNYEIEYDAAWLQLQWKPNKEWLIQMQPEWTKKQTMDQGDVSIKRWVMKGQYQSIQRQNWFVEAGYHQIAYSGNAEGSVFYDLLEGLQTGNNFTWSAQWQTMLGKLQWSAVYNGRWAQNQKIIHTGTLQIKAVF